MLLDSPIIPHLIQKLESDNSGLTFVRVDSDHIDNLIKKEENAISKLSDEEQTNLKTVLETVIPKQPRVSGSKASGRATKPSFTSAQIKEYTDKYDKLVAGKVEYIKLPSKAGSKVFRYDTETGRVYETNAKDEVANDRVDRTTFREYLGVPRKIQLP